MATRGAKSNSFLRESSLTVPVVPAHRWIPLENFLRKDKNGRALYHRAIIKNFFDVREINKHIVLNASNLKYWKLNEVMDFLKKEFREFLEDLGVAGCIEYHKADETQNSDHIHFWITDDSKYIRNKLTGFILDNNICKMSDVNIQKYDAGERIPKEEILDVEEKNLHINEKFIKQTTAYRFITKKTVETLSSIKEDIFSDLDNLIHTLEIKKASTLLQDNEEQLKVPILKTLPILDRLKVKLMKLDDKKSQIVQDVSIAMEQYHARKNSRFN